MHSISACILLLLLFFSSLVAAADFANCFEDFQNIFNATNTTERGGVDSWGRGVPSSQAVGLTYEACMMMCGQGPGNREWNDFFELFSTWLLPWLALLSQLPFGSGSYADDFISVIMTVGSPALAAYSLALTSITARIVSRRAARTTHESKAAAAARALISLQQYPLKLTEDERLLDSIPTNDQWRREIVGRLGQRNRRTVATASSLGWAIIAFVLTLAQSFAPHDSNINESRNYSVGILWLWLLCLVTGWSWLPTYTCGDSKSATPTLEASERLLVDSVFEVRETNEGAEEQSIQEDAKHAGQETEPITSSLPNPTHHQSTVPSQLSPEGQRGHGQSRAGVDPIVNQSTFSMVHSAGGHSTAQSSIHPETYMFFTPKDPSWLNRDEFRLSPTFNYSRIMGYLTLVDGVLKAMEKPTREEDEERPILFPSGALVSMFIASIFALILQCGTTAAATVITSSSPTISFGCSSVGYTIYGGTAIVIMFLNIISTIFARISETRKGRSTATNGSTASIAIILRRISLLLALVNSTGLILFSSLQIFYVFDSCYCNANVMGRGTNSYIIFLQGKWVVVRIWATIVAAVSTAVYMAFIWFTSALPTEIDY